MIKSDFYDIDLCERISKIKLVFFNDMYSNIIKIENIKEQLKSAVDNHEFVLYYQPIVNEDKIVKKVEALIRWNNKELGFVS